MMLKKVFQTELGPNYEKLKKTKIRPTKKPCSGMLAYAVTDYTTQDSNHK